MTRIDLSRLSPEEKDVLIVALLERVAALEAKLNQPPKTPGNSSVPPPACRRRVGGKPTGRRAPRRRGASARGRA